MTRVAALAGVVAMLASNAQAQGGRGHIDSCNISSTPIAFGTFSGERIDVTGNITLICDGAGNNNPYAVTLSEGVSNSFITRFMLNGAGARSGELTYNIYIDATRRIIWGNGLGETQLQAGQLQFQGGRAQTVVLPMFTRVERQALPPPGMYVDQITITVTF